MKKFTIGMFVLAAIGCGGAPPAAPKAPSTPPNSNAAQQITPTPPANTATDDKKTDATDPVAAPDGDKKDPAPADGDKKDPAPADDKKDPAADADKKEDK